MSDYNRNFTRAMVDLLFLLDRDYPKKPAIELVGNRHMLGRDDRMVLYRGVFDRDSSERRARKIRASGNVGALLVDGHNVLITLESYLSGKRVFRSLDGFVRDTAGLHGAYPFGDLAARSVELLASHVGAACPAPSVRVFLDYPVSHSGELALLVRETLLRYGVRGEVEAVRSPDVEILRALEASPSSAAATSDTVVIDRAATCVDLPAEIIGRAFRKRVADLAELLANSRETGDGGGPLISR
jgi:hypothetical protein